VKGYIEREIMLECVREREGQKQKERERKREREKGERERDLGRQWWEREIEVKNERCRER